MTKPTWTVSSNYFTNMYKAFERRTYKTSDLTIDLEANWPSIGKTKELKNKDIAKMSDAEYEKFNHVE